MLMHAILTEGADNKISEPCRVIPNESSWLDVPRAETGHRSSLGILASRWTGSAAQHREERSEVPADYHTISIALRPMNLSFCVSQRLIHDGPLKQGTARVNKPNQHLRVIFNGSYDVLNLHIPNRVLAECIEASDGRVRSVADAFADCPAFWDPVVERLSQSLLRAEDFGAAFGRAYLDGVGLAIVARLLGRDMAGEAVSPKYRVLALSKWRLKRAVEFMDSHLADSIGLADIAAAAGLSRMYFAAQFRAATGVRPHEYLLRRRIERAQDLMLKTRAPLCEVALDVGFKTQAHFTTVFSGIVGETPNVWRHRNLQTSNRLTVPSGNGANGVSSWERRAVA
jgi:AraC family transcriptional regulator